MKQVRTNIEVLVLYLQLSGRGPEDGARVSEDRLVREYRRLGVHEQGNAKTKAGVTIQYGLRANVNLDYV